MDSIVDDITAVIDQLATILNSLKHGIDLQTLKDINENLPNAVDRFRVEYEFNLKRKCQHYLRLINSHSDGNEIDCVLSSHTF